MLYFIKRNLKLYYSSPMTVFFSLLSSLIIFGVYQLFLKKAILEGFAIPGMDVEPIIGSWVCCNMMVTASFTTALGGYEQKVRDIEKKKLKDAIITLPSRKGIALAYNISAYIISFVQSIIVGIFGLVINGVMSGTMPSALEMAKVTGIIILGCYASTGIVSFIVSFIKKLSTQAVVSNIVGVLMGFLIGSYGNMSSMGENTQLVMKCFPISHMAVLLKKVLIGGQLDRLSNLIGPAYRGEFEYEMGCSFTLGGHTMTTGEHILVLFAVGTIFYLILVLRNIKKSDDLK